MKAAVTKEEIAQFIRDNSWDNYDECVTSEEACLNSHPIHVGSSVDGVVHLIYANVDGTAALLAEWLNSK